MSAAASNSAAVTTNRLTTPTARMARFIALRRWPVGPVPEAADGQQRHGAKHCERRCKEKENAAAKRPDHLTPFGRLQRLAAHRALSPRGSADDQEHRAGAETEQDAARHFWSSM